MLVKQVLSVKVLLTWWSSEIPGVGAVRGSTERIRRKRGAEKSE